MPAPAEQDGAGPEPEPKGDPDSGQAQTVEAQHQRRHRDIGRDGEDHRAAHGDVVRQAEDEAVENERQRGHRLRQRRKQQGHRGGVPDGGVGAEQGGHPERQRGGDDAEPDPGDQAQPQGAPPDPVGRVDVRGTTPSAIVRTESRCPSRSRAVTSARPGRRGRTSARREAAPYSAAAATWAVTVPQAEPSRPRCTPYTRNTSSAAFSTLAMTAIRSGVRASASPTRCPFPAYDRYKNGIPAAEARRSPT